MYSVRGDHIAFVNTIMGPITMRLSILSVVVSSDTKSSIIIPQESYFSTVINVDRVGSVLMKVPFRRFWYFYLKSKIKFSLDIRQIKTC